MRSQMSSAPCDSTGQTSCRRLAVSSLSTSLLARPLDSFPRGLDGTWRLMRWRLYGTGAAIALILTRLDVQWKPLIEKGAMLDELLEKALGQDTGRANTKKTQLVRANLKTGLIPCRDWGLISETVRCAFILHFRTQVRIHRLASPRVAARERSLLRRRLGQSVASF